MKTVTKHGLDIGNHVVQKFHWVPIGVVLDLCRNPLMAEDDGDLFKALGLSDFVHVEMTLCDQIVAVKRDGNDQVGHGRWMGVGHKVVSDHVHNCWVGTMPWHYEKAVHLLQLRKLENCPKVIVAANRCDIDEETLKVTKLVVEVGNAGNRTVENDVERLDMCEELAAPSTCFSVSVPVQARDGATGRRVTNHESLERTTRLNVHCDMGEEERLGRLDEIARGLAESAASGVVGVPDDSVPEVGKGSRVQRGGCRVEGYLLDAAREGGNRGEGGGSVRLGCIRRDVL